MTIELRQILNIAIKKLTKEVVKLKPKHDIQI